MNDLGHDVERIKSATRVDWSDDRAARIDRLMARRVHRRKVTRRIVGVAGVLALVAGGGWFLASSHRAAPLVAAASSHPAVEQGGTLAPTGVNLPLGTSVTAESADFSIWRSHDGLSMTGRGAFVVGGDTLAIRCQEVTITGSNAAFDVEHVGNGARISVTSGHIVVAWLIDSTVLDAGDSRVFPPVAAEDNGAKANASTHAQPQAKWRALALAGSFSSAYVELAKSGPASVREEAGDLFLAADVARLSKHPEEAEEPLERLTALFPSDPRAPLAAFTLGRVRLEELGHPREAAAAFAKARELAPRGPLAEDALARQVESVSRVGDTTAAHDLALQYIQAYPQGRRMIAVKRFGGVE